MKLIMFDIDGTLTKTDVADGECFVRALKDVFGITKISDDWSIYPHCTDSGILDFIFQERKGRSPDATEVDLFQSRFVALLKAEAAERPFCPVAGADKILERLLSKPSVAVSLASGAWECSARLKLASAGLDLKHLPGAFADDSPVREKIMLASLTKTARAHAQNAFEAVIYFGDGVWDARACHVLGWPFIGIAQSPAKIERLQSEGATAVFPDFEEIDACMEAIHRESRSIANEPKLH